MKFYYKIFDNIYKRNYQNAKVVMPIFFGYSTYYYFYYNYNKNQEIYKYL